MSENKTNYRNMQPTQQFPINLCFVFDYLAVRGQLCVAGTYLYLHNIRYFQL